MIDAEQRRRYLEAIGIDEWLPRSSPAPAQPGAVAGAVAATGTEVVGEVAELPPAPHLVAASRPAAIGVPVAPVPLAREPVATEPPAPQELFRWQTLQSEVSGCVRCGLHASRTQTVFGVGDLRAQWLVIGEAPGAEEDRQGEPFVGRGGRLLDAMLRAIDLERGRNVYVANMLKCRPPGNRDPKPEEIDCCLPYLMRQIALLQPRLILAVGRIAAQNLLRTDVPVGRLRGRVHQFGELNTPLVVTYHPAYLLRAPAEKRKAWEDLKFARTTFRQLTSQGH